MNEEHRGARAPRNRGSFRSAPHDAGNVTVKREKRQGGVERTRPPFYSVNISGGLYKYIYSDPFLFETCERECPSARQKEENFP